MGIIAISPSMIAIWEPRPIQDTINLTNNMANTTLAVAAKCTLAVQKFLDINNAPSKTLGEVGAIKALYSPQNRQNFEQIREFWGRGMPTPGSVCTVQIKFVKPVCATPTNTPGICVKPDDQTSPFGRLDFVLASTDIYAFNGSLPESLLQCSSDTQAEIEVATIAQYANKLLKHIDRKLIDAMIAKMGRYTEADGSSGAVSTTTPITLNIFTANGTAIQPTGWTQAIMQFDAAGANGRPIVVGGSFLKAYVDSATLAGVVNNGVTSTMPFDFYYSSNYDAAATAASLSVKSCIAFAPGEFHAVEYFDNVSSVYNRMGESFSETYTRTIISQPTVFGVNIGMDWEIRYVEECHRYDWSMHKVIGLFNTVDENVNCTGGSRKLFFLLDCGATTCPALPAAS